MGKITSPRDAASGLPTGKRMHKPISATVETASAKAPRDSVSGNATGRRAYKAVESSAAKDGFEYGGKQGFEYGGKQGFEYGGKEARVEKPVARDAASGMATGKRQHKPIN
ncbi:MAG: hypothetical protein QM723_23615 [Myxococcaceae bacterium]